MGIERQQIIIIALFKVQPRNDRLLQGGRGSDGQKVMDLFGPLRHLFRRNDVTQAPAGNGIGFGERGAGYRSLPHAGQRGKIHVLIGLINDVFINLVRDHIGIILFREGCDLQQLFPSKDFSAGVGRIAEDQSFGILPERCFQLLRVKIKSGRVERDIDGLCAGEDHVRPIVFVKGRENNQFVSRVRHSHDSGHHGLGAAAGDDDLPVRVNVHPHKMALLPGDRLSQILGTPGNGILVIVFSRHFTEPLQDFFRRVKIRKALGKIDRTVLIGDPRHAPNHGIGKSLCSCG